MLMKKNLIVILLAFAVFRISALPLPEFIRNPVWQTGFYFKNVSVGDSRAMLFALPNVYSFALNDQIGVDAATTLSMANSNFDHSTILRPTNTKFRLSYNYRDFILGTLGVRVPVFTNQFSGEQLITAGGIGSRQLGFQNANLFNALDVCLGLASSMAIKDVGEGDLSTGLGLSYLIKGAYTPTESRDLEFSPGNEFNVSLAGEYVFIGYDRQIRTLADIGFTLYGQDQYGPREEVSVGGKFNWSLFASTELSEVLPVSVRLANYRKGANENPSRYGETSKKASDLVFTMTSGIPLALPYHPFGKLTLAGYSGGGAPDVKNDAFVVTVGGGASYRLMEHIFTSAEIGVDMGKLGELGVLGIELSGTVHYQF